MAFFWVSFNLIYQIAQFRQEWRLTWIIIEKSAFKVLKFLAIPLLILINFTCSKSIVGDFTLSFKNRIKKEFFDEYEQVFGENEENLETQKLVIIFLYIFGTVLINIVVLNILISVVTDTYDIVMQRRAAEDYKYKISKLLVSEETKQILNKIFSKFKYCRRCFKLKIDCTPKYLQIIRYQTHQETQERNEGKFKDLQENIHNTKRELHSELLHIDNRVSKMMQAQSKHQKTMEDMFRIVKSDHDTQEEK